MPKRKIELDFLRGVAVILVMFRHINFSALTTQIGWIGVDLFFVLSGYLVSGILFTQYQKTGHIRPVNFLIRRGFKIYPLFYTALLLHLLYFYLKGIHISTARILSEVFFYQNYKHPGVIGVSWSLAVEEHFYLLLITGIYLLYKLKLLSKKNIIPIACLIIGVCCFVLRLNRYIQTQDAITARYFFYTHFRIDSLAFGVLISWFSFFSPLKFSNFIKKYKFLLLAVLPFLFYPVFKWRPLSAPIITFGFTFLYLAFGIIVSIMTIYSEQIHQKLHSLNLMPLYKLLAWIGIYSYSIYLIHMKAGPILSNAFKKNIYMDSPVFLIVFLNFFFNCLCGYILSILIEKPFLLLREKYFSAEK
jgi:peptidoglycan/LPS O-acetylase OafA/YrhL